MSSAETSNAILTIDLDALVANWAYLNGLLEGTPCGAAIKADAYGLGAGHAAVALAKAGCEQFFVAQIDEGIVVRNCLDDAGLDGAIHMLSGPMPEFGKAVMQACAEHKLTPVLNSLADIAAWKSFNAALACDIHVDTGMLRLGLAPGELAAIAGDASLIKGLNISYVISHLACSEDAATAKNKQQLQDFKSALALFPGCKASLANSAAIFLGPEYFFDLARPGIALYGANPLPGQPNPMAQVITLQGKILQVRDVDTPQTVGYGATHKITAKGRIATVGVGYADGYMRSLSNKGFGFIDGFKVPLVGRVSMDLLTFDVSGAPHGAARAGAMIELIGPQVPIDAVADAAATNTYELLTGLGPRYHRIFKSENT